MELGSVPERSQTRAVPVRCRPPRGPRWPRVRGGVTGWGPQTPAATRSGHLADGGGRYCCRSCGFSPGRGGGPSSRVLESRGSDSAGSAASQSKRHFPKQLVRSKKKKKKPAQLFPRRSGSCALLGSGRAALRESDWV